MRFSTWALAAAFLFACGDDNATPMATPDAPTDENLFFAKCAAPRSGNDPLSGDAYPDTQGTIDDEKTFVRLFINDVYLWYNEVPDLNPSNYTTPALYFDALKTPKTLPSGKSKDPPEFHFTYPTPTWEGLLVGVEAGYGADFDILARSPPRKIVVATVEPGSPADTAGLARGTKVLTIDGADVENGSSVTLNAGLFPSNLNETHTFVVQNVGAGASRTVTMTAAMITTTNVKVVKSVDTPTGKVGYLELTSFTNDAEAELVAGFNQLVAAGVTDLVLDLRYNGGGSVDLAGELGFMIAGPTQTANKIFEQIHFNDKYPTTDPFTGQPPVTTMFWATTMVATNGQALPHLDLPRLYVLTSDGTCSASESVMNGLEGIDVEVIQIGDTTCGKPYGFYPVDNCGTTYFAIQFQGQNAKGFGDYADGFTPGPTAGGETLRGCQVDDDFDHALGDRAEARLAAALAFRATGTCPAAKTVTARAATVVPGGGDTLVKPHNPLRDRIMTRRPR